MQPRPPTDLPDPQPLHEMHPTDLRPLLHADHPLLLASVDTTEPASGPHRTHTQVVQFSTGVGGPVFSRRRHKIKTQFGYQPRRVDCSGSADLQDGDQVPCTITLPTGNSVTLTATVQSSGSEFNVLLSTPSDGSGQTATAPAQPAASSGSPASVANGTTASACPDGQTRDGAGNCVNPNQQCPAGQEANSAGQCITLPAPVTSTASSTPGTSASSCSIPGTQQLQIAGTSCSAASNVVQAADHAPGCQVADQYGEPTSGSCSVMGFSCTAALGYMPGQSQGEQFPVLDCSAPSGATLRWHALS